MGRLRFLISMAVLAATLALGISGCGNDTSTNKPDTAQQLVENLQTKKVDAILISPLSFKGSVNTLKDAQAKGIVIVTNNTRVEGGFTDGDVECSNEDLGAHTGKAAVK